MSYTLAIPRNTVKNYFRVFAKSTLHVCSCDVTTHGQPEESFVYRLAMKLVAFRDPAWARMMGALLTGQVDYTFNVPDTLRYVAKVRPYLIFLSSFAAEPSLISTMLQRSPSSLIVYVTRNLTRPQRSEALAAGAYEAIDFFRDDLPSTVTEIVKVAYEARGLTSSSNLTRVAPVLKLVP